MYWKVIGYTICQWCYVFAQYTREGAVAKDIPSTVYTHIQSSSDCFLRVFAYGIIVTTHMGVNISFTQESFKIKHYKNDAILKYTK